MLRRQNVNITGQKFIPLLSRLIIGTMEPMSLLRSPQEVSSFPQLTFPTFTEAPKHLLGKLHYIYVGIHQIYISSIQNSNKQLAKPLSNMHYTTSFKLEQSPGANKTIRNWAVYLIIETAQEYGRLQL